ncbi:DUF1194 domain-containing protein [Marivita geojedonensis]|uniref:VWFA domain-containing protein n=1 Tax=Marivita geojedonensis TaxID=1123756 RepID=A0A1X4NLU9_9RHOB|nr:DUF1194 domain-containing protein [Marivita geojedonensis]OSQ51233.1 hypothetical protein MGEO_09205 [Marivita geojedonensis]PRY78505.1 uncharacterized protein DUF1194 [Marivita geojedonensis]
MKPLFALLALLCLLLPRPAQTQAVEVEVDLELVLMVDVSRSMTERELEIQRRGYAEALRSDAVFAALQSGLLQTVAMSYVEWAGTQEVVIDWRVLHSRADLDAFAEILTSRFDPALRRTSISEALIFGARMIETNAFRGLRRVIDISGDGPNNQGRAVTVARDAVLAKGITINGLPLLTQEGMGSAWHLDGLDIYYETCVIGGPGAFVIPVFDWDDFAEAVQRKLVLEMVSRPVPPRIIPAQATPRDPTDCLIGEKIWQERRRYWDMP